jgi:hypothetical protein
MASGKSGDIRAGGAFVELFTKQSELEKGLKEAKEKVAKLGESVMAIGEKMSLIGGAITAPFLEAAKVFAETGSALNDMSARTGISVEALSSFGYAAKQSGADIGLVEIAMRKAQRSLLEATQGSLEIKRAFDLLGLSAINLLKLSPEEQFQAIAEALNQIPNQSVKAGVAMQIFGRSGTMLLPMITDLKDLTEESKKFGLVWTGDQAAQADALGDSFDLLSAVVKKLVATIGSALAPVLTKLDIIMARVSKQTMDFAETHKDLILNIVEIGVAVVAGGAAFIALGLALKATASVIGVVSSGIFALKAAFGILLFPIESLISPIGLVMAAMAAWTAYAITSTRSINDSFSGISDVFSDIKDDAVDAFKGIVDAFKADDLALAARIAMISLKIEWLKGSKELSKIMDDWGLTIQDSFGIVSSNIASTWVDMIAKLEKESPVFKNMQTIGFLDAIKLRMEKIGVATHTAGAIVAAQFGGGNVARKVKDLQRDEASQMRGLDVAHGLPGDTEAERLRKIEEDRKSKQESIRIQQETAAKNRKQAADASVRDSEKALKDAQEELARLKKQAADEAAKNEKKPPPKSPGKSTEPIEPILPTVPTLPKIGEKAKIDVSGSFSAAALSGLGAGTSSRDSMQKEQLKEAKDQTKELKKLNSKPTIPGMPGIPANMGVPGGIKQSFEEFAKEPVTHKMSQSFMRARARMAARNARRGHRRPSNIQQSFEEFAALAPPEIEPTQSFEEYNALTPAGLDKSLNSAKQKANLAGFGAHQGVSIPAVNSGSSVKSVAEMQLEEQKKTTAQLDKLNRKAQAGRLVFK